MASTVFRRPVTILALAVFALSGLAPIGALAADSTATSSSTTYPGVTHVVNVTDDTVSGGCDTAHCSLREAIDAANAAAGTDTILFDIPGTAPHTISPATELPAITDPVILDATTQPGYAGTPVVRVDGSTASAASTNGAFGIVVVGGGSTIRGLSLTGFFGPQRAAIRLHTGDDNVVVGNYVGLAPDGTEAENHRGVMVQFGSDGNRIGDGTPSGRNVISGNQEMGIELGGPGTNNVIQGNYIGTDATGTSAMPNSTGIYVFGTAQVVGGSDPGSANVISGNSFDGVVLYGTDHVVQGNRIGTTADGTAALGNNMGVSVMGTGSLIGGTLAEGNVVAGNRQDGIVVRAGRSATIQGNRVGIDVAGSDLGNRTGIWLDRATGAVVGSSDSSRRNVISGNSTGVYISDFSGGGTLLGNTVVGNYVGTSVDGGSPLPNGVNVSLAASGNTIGGPDAGDGNVIAHGSGGVLVSNGAASNSILANRIFGHSGLGVDLVTSSSGVTPNDTDDSDSGSNGLQNFPVLTSATVSPSGTTVAGVLDSTASRSFHIEVFDNTACDTSGHGEGETFLGSGTVTTDATGDAAINLTVPGVAAGAVSATATDLTTGDTSEFSSCVTASATPGFSGYSDRIVYSTDASGSLDLWTVNPDGTDPQQVTSDPGSEQHGTWSPDGKQIAYVQDGTSLRIVDADGSGAPTEIHTGTAINELDWSPDGSKIVFAASFGAPSLGGSGFDIAVVNVDGTGFQNLTSGMTKPDGVKGSEGDPVWSPDGTEIAFNGHDINDGVLGNEVFLLDVTSTSAAPQQLTTTGGNKYRFAWHPDGAAVTYSTASGLMRVDVGDGTISSYPFGVGSQGYDWADDGNRLAWAQQTSTTDAGDLMVRTVSPAGNQDITAGDHRVFGPEWIGGSSPQTDDDGDGVADDADNCPDAANPGQEDADGDGAGDACDDDIDGDGLSNVIEIWLGCDPHDRDSDGDGVWDLVEVLVGSNPITADTDGDGVSDGESLLTVYRTLCVCVGDLSDDANGNGVWDVVEYWYFGRLHDPDTDGLGGHATLVEYLYHLCGCGPDDTGGAGGTVDGGGNGDNGIPDSVDRVWGSGKLLRHMIRCGCSPWQDGPDGDGGPWYRLTLLGDGIDLTDDDGDGIPSIIEILLGCNPDEADTDGDGVSDHDELFLHGTDPLTADTDGDGMSDGLEIALGCDPNDPDSDDDGQVDGDDPAPLASIGPCATPNAWDPVPLGSAITLCVDLGGPGLVTGGIDWGDGTSDDSTDAPGELTASHTYTQPGVYRVTCYVTDSTGGQHLIEHMVVVYDPSGGFVTGGGWIDSPAGAYAADPDMTGKANFGFVSKYRKGANVPTGSTEFQFKAGDLNFHSGTYEWLVVAGATAKFKGVGTINGSGNYGFMITASDSAISGGGSRDAFRIKIWDIDDGDAVVYDNQMGEADDSTTGTLLGGGSIVIHKK